MRVLSILRFLRVAGCTRRTDYWLAGGFVATALWALWMQANGSQFLPTYLLLIPILAGTALLDTAREGRLDLLFASGASRRAVWTTAATRTLVFNAGVVLVLIILTADTDADRRPYALMIAACGNAAIGFAGGVIRPSAGFGIIWLFTRLIFVFVPAGEMLRAHMLDVSEGHVAPVAWKLLVTMFFMPESSVVRPNLPIYVPLSYVLGAGLALFISYRVFTRASFNGRRRQ